MVVPDDMASGSRAAGADEGAHAENDEDEQHDGHGGFFFDGDWMRELYATHHLDVIPDAFGGAEEAEQADGDGNVHVEHALLRVLSGGEAAEQGEDDSDDAGDECSGRVQGRGDESYDAKEDEDEAKHDGELCHAFRVQGNRAKGTGIRAQGSVVSP